VYANITTNKEIFRDKIDESTSQRPVFASRADTVLNCRCQWVTANKKKSTTFC